MRRSDCRQLSRRVGESVSADVVSHGTFRDAM
ncbi:hypothetical protein EYF80_065515 [Liparis tanakae]|uniref:Uncharacterized protein n=1 Tax=Liparis tanakae TaxID=230148 RepID=A0A4Z2E7T1_9TELE|nr:hypothetical protein EYF80_065515 [Liparis tanakae]